MSYSDILEKLDSVLADRKVADAAVSYVASLYKKGTDEILSKIDEEAKEVDIAGREDDNQHLVHEVADLWFHCMVLLAYKEISTGSVLAELDRRFGMSGHDEKRQRNDNK